MGILQELTDIHRGNDQAFLIAGHQVLRFVDVRSAISAEIADVKSGDIVAVVGDFDARNIRLLLELIERKAIVVPLTQATRQLHDRFFEAAGVDVVVEGEDVKRLRIERRHHDLLEKLRRNDRPGLVLFTSGTTGFPKAILHDFEIFLKRYKTPRTALRTLNFLLFDHIGGLNTLLHTLFNRGCVVVPRDRTVEAVTKDIEEYGVELLPTTPTFLRMLLLNGLMERLRKTQLRIVTYGTEAMDQSTLETLCRELPDLDFRQTYGMSELGILRVTSRSRESLWMKVGGEGVETRVIQGTLWIRARDRMLGYLNADSPFVDDWYDTGDLVEQDEDYLRIVGRSQEVINVGGLKVLPEEIESCALQHPDVLWAKAMGKPNPLTGQHIEIRCQPKDGIELDRRDLRKFFQERLPYHMRPHGIVIGDVVIGHRHKRL